MRIAKVGPDEEARLAALYEFDALGDPADLNLDEVTGLAARLFDVPIALVSLVDRSRQVFAARHGLAVGETSRDVSFCAHALSSNDLLVVPDATLDPRFAGNPLVTQDPRIRFYAGAPLRLPTGYVIGTLCIIDHKPRNGLSVRDRNSLRQLAAFVLDKLERRRLQVASNSGQSRFRNIAATSSDAIVCADHQGRITFWNATAERLFGYEVSEAMGCSLDIFVPALSRAEHRDGLLRVAAGGQPRLVGKAIELDARRKDGSTVPIELSLSMWQDGTETSFGAIMRDISERRNNEDKLFQLAHHDALTALSNRSVLFTRIAEATAREEAVHLLLIDLDDFKAVNDRLGHMGGDALLKAVALRLLDCVRPSDTVARLGGDEFAVMTSADDRGDAQAPLIIAERIRAALSAPFHVREQAIEVRASIGIASATGDAQTAEELLSNAGLAMYQAKREARGCSRVFTQALRSEVLRRRAFEAELRRALDEQQFTLFYQPQVCLADGRLIGAEALVRWCHPERGLLAPGEFLSAVEEGLLASDLGQWVLETACAQAARWRARGWPLRMGVNLFEAQLTSGNLVTQVRSVLERTGLPASALELEVTENIFLRQDNSMRDALSALNNEGVSIAFDDFGTGYASLSMLKSYPLARLKIDKSFVESIETDATDKVIVSAIAGLGAGLGFDVIAEGVETEQQHQALRLCGCTSGQGYLFGKPMPADAFERWMHEQGAPITAEELRA